MRDTIDPISLTNVDESNEWLRGVLDGESDEDNEAVFGDTSLTWGDVARASGAGESSNATRSTTRARARATNPIDIIDEEETNSEETEEEEDEEGYKSADEDEEDVDLLGIEIDDD
jgi:hypothetical protein